MAGFPRPYAEIVIDLPVAQPLTYRVGEEDEAARPGACCVVQVGRREMVGLCVGRSETSLLAEDRIRPVRRWVSEVAPLPADWLAFTRFAADYYQHPWGQVAVAALPPLLRTPPGPRWVSTLKRLRAAPAVPAPAVAAVPAPPLNAEQRTASDAVWSAKGFAPLLLHGVTGSGKTEVYLTAIERLLAAEPQAQALLLVPEIGLTPQLQARLHARFAGQPIVCLHSGLPDAERSAAWLAAHEGRARIVLGTRLAVFASLPRLRLLVVDEEHDPSYKAGDGVRYSARDLAVKRAQMLGAPIVLGSATPALESWAQAMQGRYRLLKLPRRATEAAQPQVELIDLRQHKPSSGLTEPLRTALADTVARGEQALVFINRRGYAPVVACDACGWLSACPQCAVFAAFHKTDGALHCHHCGWRSRVPRACPTCGNQNLQAVGQGTQRLEETLAAALPGARILRIDRDSTRRRGAADAALAAVHAGGTDVLVGTQMIAKGHDFQRVSLVGIVNADAQLVSHDFRAPERLFATVLQVAGRAGRSGLPSRVLVQTRYPEHPLFAALRRFDYEGFARSQLAERKAAGMPPYLPQALLTAQAKTLEAALAFLARARALGRALAQPATLYDPVPMPLARLAGVFRAQMLAEAPRRSALQGFLRAWLAQLRDSEPPPGPRVRWQIEVDPQEI
jgi:primosomal protein N' (replication factor Y) (superfamily II helicase)